MTNDDDRILDDLARQGYAMVEPLTTAQVADVMKFLKGRLIYPDCHVRYNAGKPAPFDTFPDKHVLCSHNHDVMKAPHMFEHALKYTDVAARFLGVDPPVMFSCNVFWTRPGGEVRPDIQAFHRDIDDVRFLPLFILLTDVTTWEDGAQEIQYPPVPEGQTPNVQRIMGPAGTAWLADTSNLHRGILPRYNERAISWWRWGVTPDPKAAIAEGRIPGHAYVWDLLDPMKPYRLGPGRYPTDPRLRESIKLLVS